MIQTTYVIVLAGMLVGGCTIQGTGPAGSPPPATGYYGPQGPPVGAEPAVSAPAPSGPPTDCARPDNHCLEDNDVFYAERAWKGGWSYVHLAEMVSPPDAGGEARFVARKSGKEASSSFFYKTHRMQPSEIKIGAMVIALHHVKDNIYVAPTTRAEAIGDGWWMARITSVAPVATGGYVLVSGGYKVAVDALRAVDGDTSKTTAIGDDEDAHFLSRDHWLYAEGKPRGPWTTVHVAVALTPPSRKTKGEGEFMSVQSGGEVWTRWAWRTRPATERDLRKGTRVFMLHAAHQNVTRPPADRYENHHTSWWTATIKDASTAYKGTVMVSGGFQVQVAALRVAL